MPPRTLRLGAPTSPGSLEARKELRRLYPATNGYRDFFFSYGKCSISLVWRQGAVHIENLLVDPENRGKGHGDRGMRTVCKWADRHRLTLKLWAQNFDDGPLSTSRLVNWYRSFGFKGNKASMTRLPI